MKTIINVCLCAIITAVSMTISLAAEQAKTYVCPPCGCAADSKTFDKPGKCPDCGMALIEKIGSQQPGQPHQTVTVAVLLFNGAEIIDYAGPWEAFGEAGFNVFSVAETSEPMTAVFGQKITADYTFANSPEADVLLIPGGSAGKAADNPVLLKWVQRNAQTSKYVMSVCTGAFILAKAGLLDGLSATTVSGAIDRLAQTAPKTHVVHDQRYVDNGKIITTAGLSSGIDGAFHLISKIKGQGFAQSTALGMEYRWDPDGRFARAALADRYLPQIEGLDGDVLSTDGDVNRWQFQALISKPDSADGIVDLIGKRVVSATPHARGAVALAPQTPSQNGKGEVGWKFTDEQGQNWNGSALVEPSDQAGKFRVTMKLVRQST